MTDVPCYDVLLTDFFLIYFDEHLSNGLGAEFGRYETFVSQLTLKIKDCMSNLNKASNCKQQTSPHNSAPKVTLPYLPLRQFKAIKNGLQYIETL